MQQHFKHSVMTPPSSHHSSSIKLEKVGTSKLRSMDSVLILSCLIAIGCATVISILLSRFFQIWSDEDLHIPFTSPNTYQALLIESVTVLNIAFALNGALRVIASLGLFCLLVTFPQRVIYNAASRRTIARPEQIALVFLLLLLFFSPTYALWGSIAWWVEYGIIWTTYVSQYNSLMLALWNELDAYPLVVLDTYMHFIDAIAVTYIFTLWGSSLFFFGAVYSEISNDTNHAQQQQQRHASTTSSSAGGDNTATEVEGRREVEYIEKEFGFRRFKPEGIDTWERKCSSCLHQTYQSCRKFVTRCFKLFPIPLYFLASVYFVFYCGSSVALSYSPSLVPFVGIITVIRTCIKTSWEFTNATVISNVTDWTNICGSENPLQLWRAISVCGLGVLELVLMAEISRIARHSQEHLNFVPYAQTRARQLGYRYFRATSFIVAVSLFILGIIATSFGSLQPWYLSGAYETCAGDNTSCSSDSVIVTLYVDPLFAVGVNPNGVGFGPYLFLLFIWIYLASYAQLPADSFGVRGWFCKATQEQLEEENWLNDYTCYVVTENLVEHELELQSVRAHQRVVKKMLEQGARNIPKTWLHHAVKIRRHRGIGQHHKSPPTATLEAPLPPIKKQIASNALVLETELLLFQFMHISYTVCEVAPRKDPLTFAEKQALVQDKRYELIAHIESDETDTHCLLAASQDRIIIAFRGTVSYRNAQTDMDSTEMISEDALEFDAVTTGMSRREKHKATAPPLVHRGFVKAYESVKTELSILLETLWKERPDRALFLTGHSLGGGLALVAALELRVRYHLRPDSIAVTTFGSPKPGTYSFAKRYERAIPCVKRFVHSGDIVTSLPVTPPLSSLTLNGWYHIGVEVLLDSTGNMLIRPSQVENFFTQTRVSNVTNHLRLTYATALMAWCVRSHHDFDPDWWPSIISEFFAGHEARTKYIAPVVRDALLQSLIRSGVEYDVAGVRVRDVATSTRDGDELSRGELALVPALLRGDEEGFVLALRDALLNEQAKDGGGMFLTKLRTRLVKGGEIMLGIGNTSRDFWHDGNGEVLVMPSSPTQQGGDDDDGSSLLSAHVEESDNDVFLEADGEDDEYRSVDGGDDEENGSTTTTSKKKKLVLV